MAKSSLVIVESPAKAKTIGKYLGPSYQVKACMGHLRDLPKSTLGVDIENDFQPNYRPIKGKEDIISDLKKAAKAAGAKKADLIPMKDLLPLTGYIRGGCSPVGMKKPLPTFFHSTAMDFGYIFVSAGVRGLQVRVAPDRLIDYVGAEVCDLVHCVSVENCEEAGV